VDLNQLAVFVRVVEAGSFTKAAGFLKQPKSRVYRTTRQFSVTDAGRALYEHASQHVHALERAARTVHDTANEVGGILRVTAPEDFGSALLGSVIAELKELYPKLSIDLHLSGEVIDLVRDRIDVAIRIGKLEDTSLKTRPIGKITFILVAAPSYLRNARKIRTFKDLRAHPALVFTGVDEEDRWRLAPERGRAEAISVSALCRSNHLVVLRDLALAGKGVALLPEFLCVELLKRGLLMRVLPTWRTEQVPVQIVWPFQRETQVNVRVFVDLVVKRLAKYLS
jgi:LysR family transcriptional regulator, regulator for bpeEF and oprC